MSKYIVEFSVLPSNEGEIAYFILKGNLVRAFNSFIVYPLSKSFSKRKDNVFSLKGRNQYNEFILNDRKQCKFRDKVLVVIKCYYKNYRKYL